MTAGSSTDSQTDKWTQADFVGSQVRETSGARVFLGHKKLNTAMIYARALDQTVAKNYFKAMEEVEQNLELPDDKADEPLVDRWFSANLAA